MLNLQKGDTLNDRYTLIELISPTEDWDGAIHGGAMSIIWKARDNKCSMGNVETHVAIKFHPHHPSEQVDILFRREALILMQLRGHPNIVSVLDFDNWENRATGDKYGYIVTEYCDTDLSELAKRGVGAHITTFYETAIDTCRGLAYAHSRNVVHRDLKPANLFLALDRRTVKIGDFGLAKDKNDPPDPRATVVFGGSRGFRSPEKVRESTSARATPSEIRSDIYSLGVTFYQLLAGRHPYPGGHQRDSRSCRPLSTVNERVSEDLSQLIVRMIDYDPAARPSSVRELLVSLELQLKGL